jgi:tetratricopeptide (TPR) repeat protein
MKESVLKYIFFTSAALILFLMLLSSRDAGITCDEVLHYDHSVNVYNYFATHGQDKSSLNTPANHLKYYGQSYDNLVTILTKWLNIENVYGFRHIMSTVAGWLTIMVTALFAIWLTGYRTGILVLALFAVSPTFLGHSQNNLKDIPFALGYISSLYFTFRFLISGERISLKVLIPLTVSIAFAISIRAGGLLLICYLIFFYFLFWFCRYLVSGDFNFRESRNMLLSIGAISVVSWLLSILLWPYAQQSPVSNVLESYRVMAHFPDTFRQIFEGKVEWSDFMPWYYLPKSMLITIPVVVISGFLLFYIFSVRVLKEGMAIFYFFIVFTILFPIFFVVYAKSNLYSSWRQFLFVYPPIVLIAATGFNFMLDYLRKVKYFKWGIVLLITIMSVHPLKFMASNHRYSYIYYNQLAGGLQGAYGNYETDYYYVSQTEASKWLLGYLETRKDTGVVKIKATYSVSWLFRNHPETETSYFRYEERSLSDWDYAIVVNRYIPPFQLRHGIWPPENAIHIIYADKVPVCAVLKRESKNDLHGYNALAEGRTNDAIDYFKMALQADNRDEMTYYNFAAALYKKGDCQKADSLLKAGLEINPDFEPILMYLGNIARSQNRQEDAVSFYEKVIKVNRKYFEAYVVLSEVLIDKDLSGARTLLRTCLTLNPRFKPAIVALADSYRKSDPDIAKKYDELADSIKQ